MRRAKYELWEQLEEPYAPAQWAPCKNKEKPKMDSLWLVGQIRQTRQVWPAPQIKQIIIIAITMELLTRRAFQAQTQMSKVEFQEAKPIWISKRHKLWIRRKLCEREAVQIWKPKWVTHLRQVCKMQLQVNNQQQILKPLFVIHRFFPRQITTTFPDIPIEQKFSS